MINIPIVSASPLRRLGAMAYDTLLIAALLIVATTPFLLLAGDRVIVPREVGVLAYAYWLWQAAIVVLFFGYFWTRKGQTLGMRAWRLHIQRLDGSRPTWRDTLLRLACALTPWLPAIVVAGIADHTMRATLMPVGAALLVLGFVNYLIAWFDKARRSGHDRFLSTRIVRRTP